MNGPRGTPQVPARSRPAGLGAADLGAADLTGGDSGPGGRLAAEIIELLTERHQTVAVAESLTGGLVAATLTSVAGSSLVFTGAVVAYASWVKTALLDVPEPLLAAHGPVHPGVATAMAVGVQKRLDATYGIATTGVAGPGPADRQAAGTVFVAVAGPGRVAVEELTLPGDRQAVRVGSVLSALTLLVTLVREDTN
jgi:nicotinamide-nucleotide amidase